MQELAEVERLPHTSPKRGLNFVCEAKRQGTATNDLFQKNATEFAQEKCLNFVIGVDQLYKIKRLCSYLPVNCLYCTEWE